MSAFLARRAAAAFVTVVLAAGLGGVLGVSAASAAGSTIPVDDVVPVAEFGTTGSVGVLSLSDCPSGSACLWASSSYAGSPWAFSAVGSVVNRPASVTSTKAMWNRSDYRVILYSGSNGTGSSACYASGWQGSLSGWAASAKSAKLSSSC